MQGYDTNQFVCMLFLWLTAIFLGTHNCSALTLLSACRLPSAVCLLCQPLRSTRLLFLDTPSWLYRIHSFTVPPYPQSFTSSCSVFLQADFMQHREPRRQAGALSSVPEPHPPHPASSVYHLYQLSPLSLAPSSSDPPLSPLLRPQPHHPHHLLHRPNKPIMDRSWCVEPVSS